MDKVHDMMDDIAEQQDLAKEISEAISNPVAFGDEVDEVRALPLYNYKLLLSFLLLLLWLILEGL